MQQQQQQQQTLRRTKRRRRPSTRTLLPFLRACVGCPVVVELTNDDVMRGTLESVDDGMNLVLVGGKEGEGVRWTRRGTSEPRAVLRGREQAEEEPSAAAASNSPFFAPSLHVRGRRVRFVHLPPSVDPGTVVDAAREAAAAARAAYRREILTRAHGGGGGSSRSKGTAFDSGRSSGSSDEGDNDDEGNNQYYYEDFDDDDDDEGEEEQR